MKKEHIPPSRVILYTILGCFLVTVGAFFWMSSTISNAETSEKELQALGEKLLTKTQEQETNRQVVNHYRGKDPLFLHQKLESLPLLVSEVAALRAKTATSALPEDLILEKRLASLTSGENTFAFVESATEVGKFYKEVVEHQTKPVEVDTEELATILNILEGDQTDDTRPDLLISDARIERRKGALQETWGLSLNIVRREYLP